MWSCWIPKSVIGVGEIQIEYHWIIHGLSGSWIRSLQHKSSPLPHRALRICLHKRPAVEVWNMMLPVMLLLHLVKAICTTMLLGLSLTLPVFFTCSLWVLTPMTHDVPLWSIPTHPKPSSKPIGYDPLQERGLESLQCSTNCWHLPQNLHPSAG